ncbi:MULTISPECIES: hypothetical protein [Cyanophyceae]|uniref:XRE family transcriptional regulator n=1 Tax=Leptolyngbya subtilissima DQ-A4 TaxID=2933933 RepID=A0ABV0K125_9CYAN|nr:hypothetical protein [Nodosilinea sp. FACHB-141]MBD2111254.1 hypothetical protein [Nodosilinea sp. FACHB-141]
MSTAYYPWNVQVLVEWLRLELRHHGSSRDLSTALQVPSHTLSHWLQSSLPTVTLQDIRCIAQYRGWSVRQTLRWLELQPAHVDALIVEDPLSYRVSWSDAMALWFGPPAA